jgi:hypothetical protein
MSPPSRSRRLISLALGRGSALVESGVSRASPRCGALAVVMGCVAVEYGLEVPAADDQQPIETFGADGENNALGIGVRLRGVGRRVDHVHAFAAEDLVEGCAEFAVAVVDQEAHAVEQAGEAEVRACWVTQERLGLVVQPAKWTRRLPSSMKYRT